MALPSKSNTLPNAGWPTGMVMDQEPAEPNRAGKLPSNLSLFSILKKWAWLCFRLTKSRVSSTIMGGFADNARTTSRKAAEGFLPAGPASGDEQTPYSIYIDSDPVYFVGYLINELGCGA